MPSSERAIDRALRRSERVRLQLGEEIRAARMAAGTSQLAVAKAARVSQSEVSRIEAGKLKSLSIEVAIAVGDVVGLDVSIKAYPGRRPTRDAGHARRLTTFLSHVASPLRFATEVVLPRRDGVPEQRAWDAVIFAPECDCGVELEMRLYDIQSQIRRIHAKWRDSGARHLLLLINDTRSNRAVLHTFDAYVADLPRLRKSAVLAALERGTIPGTGYVLI